MSDRELLEAAARAAGIELDWKSARILRESGGFEEYEFCDLKGTRCVWNPLNVDGDALRLAVKLRLVILIDDYLVRIGPRLSYPDLCFDEDATESQRCKIVRLAIVTTAAAIGNKLEKSDGQR